MGVNSSTSPQLPPPIEEKENEKAIQALKTRNLRSGSTPPLVAKPPGVDEEGEYPLPENTEPPLDKNVCVSSRDEQVQSTWGFEESQSEYYLQSITINFPEAMGPFPGPMPEKMDDFSQKQLAWLVSALCQKLELEEKKKQKKPKPAFNISKPFS